jgi:LMBR1-like membrane protein
VCFAVCSVFLLLGEATLFVNTNVSIFPLIFEDQTGELGTQLLCLIVMGYLFSCTYIGLFTLRIEGSYGLYGGNHTDPANFVWSAFFTTRIVHPLIYNFLLLIKVHDTQFHKVMGVMNIVPFLGSDFCEYFPMIIVFFAFLNAVDFYTWLMVKIGFPQLSFSDNFDKGRLAEGKSLLKKCKV